MINETIYVDALGFVDLEVDVSFTLSPFYHAYTSGLPEDCYPEEGGDVEDFMVTAIYCGSTEDIYKHLSVEVRAAVINKAESQIQDKANNGDYNND